MLMGSRRIIAVCTRRTGAAKLLTPWLLANSEQLVGLDWAFHNLLFPRGPLDGY